MDEKLFLSTDYSQNSLDQLVEVYEKLSFDNVNDFKKVLFKLFEGEGLNTKTKKSELYQVLEDNLKIIYDLVAEMPKKKFKGLMNYIALKSLKVKDDNTCSIIPNEKDMEVLQNYAILSTTIQAAIKIKLISRYEKLLPKRRFKDFKEKYPLLESCFVVHEQYGFNLEASENYIKIHNNNGISEQIQKMHLCKATEGKYKNIEFKLKTNNGAITLNIDKEEGETSFDFASRAASFVGPKQQQLLIYIMSLVFEQNKPEDVKNGCGIDIDLKEYCKLKGIKFRKEAADDIKEDLQKLEKIFVEYEYYDTKGKKRRLEKSVLVKHSGTLHKYGDSKGNVYENAEVGVILGKWIETLSYDQFQYIKNAFFKYKLKKDNGSLFPLAYYINCQHRNNFTKSKNGEFKISVKKLTEKMNIDKERVKSKGYTATLKKPLENYLNTIKEDEGFEWKYKNGVHNSRKDFEEDVIIFKNSRLDNLYFEKGLTRKEAKKK